MDWISNSSKGGRYMLKPALSSPDITSGGPGQQCKTKPSDFAALMNTMVRGIGIRRRDLSIYQLQSQSINHCIIKMRYANLKGDLRRKHTGISIAAHMGGPSIMALPCSYVKEEHSTSVSLNLGVKPALMTLSLAAMHSIISPLK